MNLVRAAFAGFAVLMALASIAEISGKGAGVDWRICAALAAASTLVAAWNGQ
jgi:hypothetical protein